MAEQTHYHYARGRRKEAVATVRLYPGKGEVHVNEQPAADYFNNVSLVTLLERPVKLAGQDQKLRISLHVKGGGKRGQADAASLAIARALNVMSEDLRPTLKKARKAPQFSKR